MNDNLSLSHTRWNCKYHIVFIPKYRRKAIYGKLRSDIGQIIRQLYSYKGVEIIEAHAMPDHIHMLVRIPPKIAVSNFMGYLKGKSSLIIFEVTIPFNKNRKVGNKVGNEIGNTLVATRKHGLNDTRKRILSEMRQTVTTYRSTRIFWLT